jgi:branched-chain amino acid transport system substrate-binding protein
MEYNVFATTSQGLFQKYFRRQGHPYPHLARAAQPGRAAGRLVRGGCVGYGLSLPKISVACDTCTLMNIEKLDSHWRLRWARGLIGLLILLSLLAAGCSGPMPPLPAKPPANASVRVAVLTPMTGELATFGEIVRNGITLAFDDWNDRGGVNGQLIEWVLEDTRCDPVEGRRAAEHAINEGGARFIVGGVCSEAAVPIARVADERGALFVATTATHPLVTADATGAPRPLVFRACYAYPYQGRGAARFALDDLNARRAAVLVNPVDDYVRSLSDEFVAVFVSGGGQVVAMPTYPQKGSTGGSRDADFDAIIADLAKAEPEVLYVPDAYPVANRVGSAVRAQGLDVTLVGSDVWDNGALDLEALEGAYFTLQYSRANPDAVAKAWGERYLSAFAVEPDTLAALGYDAASMLASAIDGAGSLAPDDVALRLEAMEFEGVTGRWRIDARHNPLKPVVVVHIEGGDVIFHSTIQP